MNACPIEGQANLLSIRSYNPLAISSKPPLDGGVSPTNRDRLIKWLCHFIINIFLASLYSPACIS
jgi:hypothetical protein